MMTQCFFTPVPSRRVSNNARVEFRLAATGCSRVRAAAVFADGRRVEVGVFEMKPALELVKAYPTTDGLLGQFEWELCFEDASGAVVETLRQPYEIIVSDVHSTCLLDGCWISIRHWSPTESRCFKDGLELMTDEDWRQHVFSMHKLGITTVLIQNVFDSVHYVHQHDMTADTYDGVAFFDSKLAPRRPNMLEKDPLEAILSAADECGMAVFPGVGMYAWFDFSPESLIWHKRVATELIERYGHHHSFYGFYISEEIMGALYYGYPPVPDEKYKDIILRLMAPVLSEERRRKNTDYKTALQQFVEQEGSSILSYRTVSEEGPEHSKLFYVAALINNNVVGEGQGKTIKAAEQMAARAALALFGVL